MNKRILGASALMMLATGSTVFAQAEPSLDQLKEQLQTLQRKVEYLETQQKDDLQLKLEKDAQARSTAAPFTAGWNKGSFTLQSEDGNFSLTPGVQFQLRYVANLLNDSKNGSQIQDGFEIRRTKFSLGGHAFSKDLDYSIVFSASRNGGTVGLEEAWVKYRFADQWSVRGGLFKDPLSHEQQSSSKKLLAVDRSLLNEYLIGSDDFVQGVGLLYGDDSNPLHAEFAFTDGSQSGNTDFRYTGSGFGLAARVEYKFEGDWKNYSDFSALNNKKDLFVLGAGVDFTQYGSTNALTHTIDAQYELTNGWGFYVAYVGLYAESDDESYYEGGILAQASYLLDRHWEIFGRYDFLWLDEAFVPAGHSSNLHEITAGVNYYLESHNAKFTIDVVYLPDGAPSSYSGIGVLASDDSEFILRAQFQLLL